MNRKEIWFALRVRTRWIRASQLPLRIYNRNGPLVCLFWIWHSQHLPSGHVLWEPSTGEPNCRLRVSSMDLAWGPYRLLLDEASGGHCLCHWTQLHYKMVSITLHNTLIMKHSSICPILKASQCMVNSKSLSSKYNTYDVGTPSSRYCYRRKAVGTLDKEMSRPSASQQGFLQDIPIPNSPDLNHLETGNHKRYPLGKCPNSFAPVSIPWAKKEAP